MTVLTDLDFKNQKITVLGEGKKQRTLPLRHSFASHLNDEDVDVLVIQDLLGHATPRTTTSYYRRQPYSSVREKSTRCIGKIARCYLFE